MAFKIMGFIMAFYTHTNSLLICFPLFPFSLPSYVGLLPPFKYFPPALVCMHKYVF